MGNIIIDDGLSDIYSSQSNEYSEKLRKHANIQDLDGLSRGLPIIHDDYFQSNLGQYPGFNIEEFEDYVKDPNIRDKGLEQLQEERAQNQGGGEQALKIVPKLFGKIGLNVAEIGRAHV